MLGRRAPGGRVGLTRPVRVTGARADGELTGFIPTGNDIPALKSIIILILAMHLLLALHRVYQRAGRLAAENTVLREETEGLV